MYFEKIQKVAYLLNPAAAQAESNYVVLTDITKNVRFKTEIIDNIVIYDYYHIADGETLEQISEKLYGTPEYHWVLMLLNNRFDWRSDLPMSEPVFEEYLIDKYGSVATAQSTIVFYRSNAGLTVDQNHLDYTGQADSIPVTAFEMEVSANEEKRKIKVVSRAMMSLIIKNYTEMN